MKAKTKCCLFGVFCLIFALAVSEALAQTIVVEPANPAIAAGETQQFTASGNLTPSLVSAGGFHTCALLPDGTVRCWGESQYGQLGHGTTTNSSTPVAVAGLTSATAVAAGYQHSCALISDGTVRCWGLNNFGQLGNGTILDASIPVVVGDITTATAVTAGAWHNCALLSDGTVRCWGRNDFGQLGDGTVISSPIPTLVAGLAPVTAITAGAYHTCAQLLDGAVQCWGRNEWGQLGDGTTYTSSSTPTAVAGLPPVTAVAAGGYHNCTPLPDATVQCWGRNQYGQLGNGTSLTYPIPSVLLKETVLDTATVVPGSHSPTPVEVAGISTATAATTGAWHNCALLSDGSAKCWGRNDFGQLGDGTVISSSTPVAVFTRVAAAAAVTAGGYHTCARLPDATVQCWGFNRFGQLGDGTTSDSSPPVAVTGSGPVTWTSSDTAVATIDAATGLATALSPGFTTITATANGASGSTVLTVVSR